MKFFLTYNPAYISEEVLHALIVAFSEQSSSITTVETDDPNLFLILTKLPDSDET